MLRIRAELKMQSDLGEFGDQAIHDVLYRQGVEPLPSVRTISRILERRGALDGRYRLRRPAPPRGWYLPTVATGQAELDGFDIVEGLIIRGGIGVEVLTASSLHGRIVAAWPETAITARVAAETITAHWRTVGLPDYAQFDNDTRFQGPHQHADSVGRVSRLCLSLGVVPVFVPPLECGFQAVIENFNGRWQAKVWSRFQHVSLQALQAQSAKFITASRRKTAPCAESAPPRRTFPEAWRWEAREQPQGRLVFLRRTTEAGRVSLLGHTFLVDRAWLHRLVRAEVDLQDQLIRVYALRRREPAWQPLLREIPYELPNRPFRI